MKMKPFDLNSEFLGQALLPAIFALPSYAQRNMLKLLKEEGLTDPSPEKWYNIKIMIAFHKKLAENFGPNTLFDLGKSVPENAEFPPAIDSIEKALNLIDVAYNMNHRNGYLGFYKMVSHDPEEKKIVMQCYNPYPCDSDRGMLTAMARKFKSGVRVVVDEDKPSKKKGGNESWYTITYR